MNYTYTKKYSKQLKKAQQHLSRKKKGSNGFEKQKLKVANLVLKYIVCSIGEANPNTIKQYILTQG